MVGFTSPYWFLLTSLVLPLAILHFNSRKPGKSRPVGSIAFILNKDIERGNSRKLTELVLFFLRVFVILSMSLLLAGPFFIQNIRSEGWILGSAHDLELARLQSPAKFDSLLKAGYEIHRLLPGFPVFKQTSNPDPGVEESIWNALKALNGAKMPVVAFSRPESSLFPLEKPQTRKGIQIYLIAPDCRESKQVSKLQDFLKKGGVVKVSIFAAPASRERLYLLKALKAVCDLHGQILLAKTWDGSSKLQQALPADWIFWLLEKDMPAEAFEKSGLPAGKTAIMRFETRRPSTDGILVSSYDSPLAGVICRHFKAGDRDVFVLRPDQKAQTSELVWNAAFPEMIESLLLYHLLPSERRDNTASFVDQGQARHFRRTLEKAAPTKLGLSNFSLEMPLWIFLLVLIVAERLVAFLKDRQHAYNR